MARDGPSLTALLGLLAVAGYQHRDKIGDLLKRVQGQQPHGAVERSDSGQSPLDGILDMFAGGAAQGTLFAGLKDLVETFRGNGFESQANSWVSSGANQAIDQRQVRDALGDETLDDLSRRTGLSRDEILTRLSTNIPAAVDDYTRGGRLPDEEEVRGYL